VEIAIGAAALNFLDVLKAMGVYPGLEADPAVALGAECAGVVVAVGPDVDDVAVGDEVVAITPSYEQTSMLGSHVTVPADFVVPRPEHLAPEDACALPVAYLTAHYALLELAHLRAGERVLIHSAAGGVGLAAIEICRDVGAEVLATAGTSAKRDHLRALGIEHVFDSRTLAFGDEVRACTGGRGVDVVLNSLVGDAIPAGLSTLAPRGRFVEIGKRDVYANARLGLEPFKNNLSFFAVDLAGLTRQDPAYVSGMFRAVMEQASSRRLAPLPVTVAPITEAADVFRTMARGGHIGKLVLISTGAAMPAEVGAVRPDSSYAITGGLGALGLAVAERLVELGARHLVLLGRSHPSPEAAVRIGALEGRGAQVRVVRVDVTDAESMGVAFADVRATMPPLRGVVHAAGTLADATVTQMDPARLGAALAPKLDGGWNLHAATLDDPLDFFVSFSSVAGVLGLSGQSNYAAGNAFLDGLAHARRAAGRPGSSIDWGPWSDIGLAALEADRGDRLAERGLMSITPDEALDVFERLLAADATQVSVMRFDVERWLASGVATGLLDGLAEGAPATVSAGGLRERLADTPPGPRRRTALEDAIRVELALALRTSADRIDRNRPLESMGLDSLMSLEFRNRLESETGLKLSATLAFNYPTVAILADHLAARLELELDVTEPAESSAGSAVSADTPAPAGTATDAAEVLPDDGLDDASDEDVEALLGEELAAIERLLESDGRSS